MKKILYVLNFLITWVLIGQTNVNAQNVGIGIATPTSKLDVNGQVSIEQKNFGGYGGLLIKGGSPGLNYPNICFSTANSAAPSVDVVAGYIGGSINSNIAGSESMDLIFSTSATGQNGLAERLRIKYNGNIGIGTNTPNAPLQFGNDVVSRKIVLFDEANNNHQFYGFGRTPDALLYQVNSTFADHAFFAGADAANSVELFRIKGNGNVGIGTNSPQGYGHGGSNKILEVFNAKAGTNIQSHIVLTSNGNAGSLGGITWAAPAMAGAEKRAGYIGSMLDLGGQSARLGFFTRSNAGSLSEILSINSNGSLSVNGNPGLPGQVLMSKGGSLPAAWTNKPLVMYFNQSGDIDLRGDALCAPLTGINGQVFTVPEDANVLYQCTVTLATTSAGSGYSLVNIQLVDASLKVVSEAASVCMLQPYEISTIAVSGGSLVPAGTYQVRAKVARPSPSSGIVQSFIYKYDNEVNCNDVNISPGQLILQILPK